jgi:tripartite-type tricarboxylate transporter receptor subunit TctC
MKALVRLVLIVAACAVLPPVSAQNYPAKPIRLIVPFPPGASTDLFARLIANKFSETAAQRMIAENRPGATGSIGLDTVAKSPPDGYTLGVLIISHAVHSAIDGAKMPYDLARDFTPVIQFSSNPYLLTVHPSLPVKSVAELVALAKARPGALRYGSSGTGGIIHLAGAWLASATKTQLIHVPYKGSGPAMIDVIAGHIEFIFASIPTAGSFMKQQKLRGVAVTTARRLEQFPNLQTMQEAGIKDYVAEGWNGLAGPARMPSSVVEALNSAVLKILGQPETRSLMAAEGATAVGGTPREFAAHISSEIEKWGRIVKQAGIKTD